MKAVENSCNLAQELELSQTNQTLEVLLNNYWIQITTCGKQVCLQVIILYTYYTCNYKATI